MPTCTTVRLIAGPRGTSGTPGTDGTDGVNAYTVLTANFTMPAELGEAFASVLDTSWMAPGNKYYLQNAGWLQVTDIPSTTSVKLMNLKDTASDAYMDNVAPTTLIPLSSKLVAAGIQGPPGTDGAGGAPTDATYILQTVDASLPNAQLLSGLATGLVKNTIGTGVLSIVDIGVTDQSIPLIDDAGGLTNGQAVFATAAGIETLAAASARTALGLGTIATQAASAVTLTGGAISGTSITGSTGSFTTLAASSSTFLNGVTQVGVQLAFPAGATQTLLAANPVVFGISVKAKVAGSGGAVTITALPSVTQPSVDGVILIIQGTSDANTITLQDNGTLPGSLVSLGAATRTLGNGDILVLLWDNADLMWYEVSFSNV